VRVSVIGTGYLGAVHAAGMAELGFEVVGVDVDADRIATLAEGRVPFYEPDLEPLLRKHVESGRLTFSTDAAATAEADVHFLCVGTPQRSDGPGADLSHVDSAVESLRRHVRPGSLVVGKSTVPVGTAARVAEQFAEYGVGLAWNPEFLREGHAVADTLRPDRLVFGVRDDSAEAVLREVYADAIAAETPVVVTDLATSELVKTSANAFLATKISFVNAIAEVCDAAGADVTTLADALGHDVRIGRQFLGAGLGFGGGCLPKDVRAFRARAAELGIELGLLAEVDAINLRRRDRVVELTTELLGGDVRGRKIAALGAAFKPNSDDVRDSPALDVARRLAAAGARVRVHDPVATEAARRVAPDLEYADSAFAAAAGSDVVLHLTEWKDYRAIDPVALGEIVTGHHVVDARNCLDRARWRQAGWTYRGLGVS
jgi:UDPglucose 6-dehydrogenase